MRYNTTQFNLDLNSVKDVLDNNPAIITSGEFFAGGGGWTEGMSRIPGIQTKWILNHDKVAIKTNAYHHPEVKVYWADVYTQDEHELEPVDYIHASIECTQHSRAKGGQDKKLGSYTMGWELYRYIKFLQPLVLSIENVPEFKKWSPVCEDGNPIKAETGKEFERWKKAIEDLGYKYKESVRNAADDGLPTRRVRYFAFFYREGIDMEFPEYTHSKKGNDGKLKWKACRPHIDLHDEGTSIFGRTKKPAKNTLRRLAGGIKKYFPEFNQFICHYYGGNPNRFQSLDSPLNTVTCSNRHQLVTLEKLQFIQDYCRTDNYHTLEEPMKPQLTWQTKQFATIEQHFVSQYYGSGIQVQDLESPLNTVTCTDRHLLVRIEKLQFLTHFFSGWGNLAAQNQTLDTPINTILGKEHTALVTLLDNFDIKIRMLNREELAGCSTFPRQYFSGKELKLSNKDAVKMIGNAVPPDWPELLVNPNVSKMVEYKLKQNYA